MRKENGVNRERWEKMEEGARMHARLLRANIPRIAAENPIVVGHAIPIIGMQPTQVIQPWMFGHRETKATCLWLINLPKLVPTNIVGPPPRDPEKRKSWARVHRMPPGPNRQADRARTYAGIGEAFAQQWGSLPSAAEAA